MKRTITAAAILLAAFTVFGATPAIACMFDTDCYPGSRCLKAAGALYGYCAGGLNPGNSYDSNRWDDPLDYGGTKGDTCMFSTDCFPGQKCIKSSGSLKGTCL